jgi:predicted ATP-grasp superfamily ATP-dependent carboligase
MTHSNAVGPARPPAIVLGCDMTGLGALRSLVLAGIPAYSACPADDLVTRSRWYRPTPGAVPWDGGLGAGTEALLRDMPLAEAVLIPGADDAAIWLAELAGSDLGRRFHTSVSAVETLRILQDKDRFAAYLAGTDIPHPRTFAIASAADIEHIPFEELDRVFIKPSNSQKFSQTIGAKGVWARSRGELGEIWAKLHDQGFRLMAQEYVPGSSSDHYFVDGYRDRGGNLTGLFARRRIRIYPPDFGNSSYCRSIALAEVEDAVASVTKLLAMLDYRGIFSAEFKRDARNGQYRILEVNTRAWWYVEFAARCGVNVCRMAYEDALGLPVTAATRQYRSGVGCVNLYGDLRTVRAQTASQRGPIRLILWQWVRAYFQVFRLSDPMPAISILGSMLMRSLRRRLGAR